jgi:hypothetical protein
MRGSTMAKENKDKKQPVQIKEPVKELVGTRYHDSVGILKDKEGYKVVLTTIGTDGSSKLKEEYKASGQSAAIEMSKIWFVNKVIDSLKK